MRVNLLVDLFFMRFFTLSTPYKEIESFDTEFKKVLYEKNK